MFVAGLAVIGFSVGAGVGSGVGTGVGFDVGVTVGEAVKTLNDLNIPVCVPTLL